MKPKFPSFALLSLLTLSFTATTHAQTTWDGGGNSNLSGNWNTDPTFWNPDGVPDAVPVELNDVTSGTRTVTLSAAASVSSLAINQSTADAVNALALDTAEQDLSITDPNGFAMSNSTGQTAAISLLLSGGDIRLTDTGGATVTLDGNTSISNGSRFVMSNSGTGSTYQINGPLNLVGGGDNGSPGLFVGNGVGIYNVADGATLDVSGGLAVFGRSTSGSTNRGQTLNNLGEVTVENGALFRIDSVQSFEQSDFNNSGTTTLGDAVTAGQAILDLDTSVGGSGGVGRFDNQATGELFVHGSSHIDLGNRSDASANAVFTNAEGGQVTFAGDATGAGIRSTFGVNDQVYATVTNSGALTVTHHSSVAEGLGVISHGGRAARLLVSNAATGVFTVEDSANLAIRTENNGTGPKTVVVSNAGTMVIGDGAADTPNGSTVSIAALGTTSTTATVTVTNSGNLQLKGASVMELTVESIMTAWTLTNDSGGTTELNGTSTLGNTSTTLNFSNAGILTKTGSGTGSILSNGSGTATNTGTIDIQAGQLSFSESINASDAASVVKVIVSPATAGATPQLVTSGTLTYGGTLELVVNTATPAGTYNLFDSTGVAGSFATITLSGSGGFTGSTNTSSIVSGGNTFTFNSATGELTVNAGGLSALEQWRLTNFGSSANTGSGADDADFDFDGIENLIEYATGSDPKTSSVFPLTTGEAGGFFTVTFNRIADASLTYSVTADNDLAGGGASEIFTSTGAANTAGPVTATDTVPMAGNPKRFARLKVTH